MTASRFVQLRNPRSDRYVKVDRARGSIVAHKASPGPYLGVPVVRERRIAEIHVHTVHTSRWRGWCVRIAGRQRAFARYGTKRKACAAGRQLATRYGVPLVIHAADGTVALVVAP